MPAQDHTTYTFYMVDEKKFTANLGKLSGREKYDRMVEVVTTYGTSWAMLELKVSDFERVLDLVDSRLGATVRFLHQKFFSNSPHQWLADETGCPAFGYLDPVQTRDLHERLEKLPAEWVDALLESSDETSKEVLYAIQSSAEEAGRRGYAMAIIHS